MPPVRDASTKPSAATVLPAPVACSNQKRLSALGSSGCSSSWASSSLVGVRAQSCGSSGSSSSSSRRPPRRGSPTGASATRPRRTRAVAAVRCRCAGPRRAARSACPRGRRPGGRLSTVPSASARLLVAEQPLEAEQQRERAAPLDRRTAWRPRRARRARRRGPRGAGVPGASAVARSSPSVEEGLAGELLGPFEVRGRGGCVACSATGVVQPRKARRSGKRRTAALGCDDSGNARGLDVEPGVAAAAPPRIVPPASASY